MPAPTVELNEDFVNALAAAIERARERGLVAGALTPGDLLRLPQAMTVRERPAEADPAVEAQLAASVEAALEQALADLDAMRIREGDHLRADLDGRRQLLAGLVDRLDGAALEGRVRRRGAAARARAARSAPSCRWTRRSWPRRSSAPRRGPTSPRR